MNWLAIDIGGANLKLADGLGFASSYAFALWKDSSQLARELRTVIAEAPPADHLAVTMTGELADCFESKTEGVQFILSAIQEAADGRYVRVYLQNGKMVTPQVAGNNPLPAASSNWHALACFAGRYARKQNAILMDIGSTTTDIIPLSDGQPVAAGHTDTQRLIHSELVYTGIERSPICALINTTPYRGKHCPVAQEVFATTRDVYLMLGRLLESDKDKNTADGKPSTRSAARRRMGRMLSATGEEFNSRDATMMAEATMAAQMKLIGTAIRQVIARQHSAPETIILSGHGEFLARKILADVGISARQVSLAQELGIDVSRCAPAHALAVLAREAAGL